MSMIQVKELSFQYPGNVTKVFEKVSFTIDTNWKLGLIGRNGKGKTTFLHLLLEKYSYEGKIDKKVEVDYFPFTIEEEEKMTLEILQEMDAQIEDWKVIRELNLLKTEPEILYRNYSTLSGGEKVKVQLAVLFAKENNFLLIDEPTNHLDNKTKENVEQYLEKKQGFILVSHDRNLLDSVVDHIIAINNTNIEIQKGNYTSWKENKERQDHFEFTQNESLKKEIGRLQEASKSATVWSNQIEKTKCATRNSGLRPDRGYIGHQSAKMMKKAKVIEARFEKQIEEKGKLLKNIDRVDLLTIKPLEFEKKTWIIAKNLQIKYEEKRLGKVTFELQQGDRIALTGKNGSGKTSILKLILGEKLCYEGEFNIANHLKISYVSQLTNELKGSLSHYAEECNVEEGMFKAMLSKMGFSTEELSRKMEDCSEGQKKKILVARSICENSHLYIWDEPLNYIDIPSREQIEDAILEYKPTMIFVEHDGTFVEKIATKKIEM